MSEIRQAPPRRRSWFARWYGANPVHLASLVLCFAVAAYAAQRWLDAPSRTALLLWFAGAVVAHDAVFFPAYTIADRFLTRGTRAVRVRRVPVVNHVRVPLLLSGLLLLIWFPLIASRSEPAYQAATGLDTSPYLGRWVAVSVAMAAVSAALYLARVLSGGAAARSGSEAKANMPSSNATDADQPRS